MAVTKAEASSPTAMVRNNYEFLGLSTDKKPSEQVPLNSLFLELDTGDFYYLASKATSYEKVVWEGTIVFDLSEDNEQPNLDDNPNSNDQEYQEGGN